MLMAWLRVVLAVIAIAGFLGGATANAGPQLGKVAYAVHLTKGRHPGWIVMSNLDGSNVQAVTPQPSSGARRRDTLPAFSPDGKSVAFFRKDGKRSGLYVVQIDTGSSRRVVGGDARRFDPTGPPRWSPDGQSIAFGLVGATCPLTNPRNAGIYVTRIDSGRTRKLPALRRWGRALPSFLTVDAWSPDGARLLYSEGQFGGDCRAIACCNAAVYQIGALGGDPTVVQKPADDGFVGVGWSSDGTMLAYEDCQQGGCAIKVRTPTRTRKYYEAFTTAAEEAVWAPRGHRLAVNAVAFNAPGPSQFHLDVVDVDQDTTVVLGHTSSVDALGWSNDDAIVALVDWPPRTYVFSTHGEPVQMFPGPRAPKDAALNDFPDFSLYLP
jgi:dipeptidyl aminopeptidase/acylaminoacyl peptidase